VLEGLRRLVASGASCGTLIIPGRVRAEVAVPQSHLVEPSRVEFVETHEGVMFERGGAWVPRWRGATGLPFLHESVAATPPELRVGTPFRGLWVGLGQEMLRGNWEGGEPVRAQQESHRVRDRIWREVGPVLGGGAGLKPL